MATETVAAHRPVSTRLAGILLAGGAVAVAVGVYGNEHDPTHEQPYTLFFTNTLSLKAWFASAVLVLAGVQVLLGMRLFGKISIPRTMPSWLGDAHRIVGTLAFGLSLPVAYHCLWSIGFQSTDARVITHSLLGCFFYGIFTVKVLSVRVHGLPDRMLPVVGGLVFAALVGIWLTSSLWFFTSRPSGPLF